MRSWLTSIGLENHEARLIEYGVTKISIIELLSLEDLLHTGMPLQDSRKLLNAIEGVMQQTKDVAEAAQTPGKSTILSASVGSGSPMSALNDTVSSRTRAESPVEIVKLSIEEKDEPKSTSRIPRPVRLRSPPAEKIESDLAFVPVSSQNTRADGLEMPGISPYHRNNIKRPSVSEAKEVDGNAISSSKTRKALFPKRESLFPNKENKEEGKRVGLRVNAKIDRAGSAVSVVTNKAPVRSSGTGKESPRAAHKEKQEALLALESIARGHVISNSVSEAPHSKGRKNRDTPSQSVRVRRPRGITKTGTSIHEVRRSRSPSLGRRAPQKGSISRKNKTQEPPENGLEERVEQL